MKHLRTIEWLILILGIIMILQGIRHYPEVGFWNALMVGGGCMALPFFRGHAKTHKITYGIILTVYVIINFLI